MISSALVDDTSHAMRKRVRMRYDTVQRFVYGGEEKADARQQNTALAATGAAKWFVARTYVSSVRLRTDFSW
jgi:hypothetical protein